MRRPGQGGCRGPDLPELLQVQVAEARGLPGTLPSLPHPLSSGPLSPPSATAPDWGIFCRGRRGHVVGAPPSGPSSLQPPAGRPPSVISELICLR